MSGRVLVGRWQDVLPGAYDPARAVVITDPPYGLEAAAGAALRAPGGHGGRGRRPPEGKGYPDAIPWGEHVAEVLARLPARRHVIRGPSTVLVGRAYPAPRRLCVEVASYRRRAMQRPGVVPYLWQGWAVYGRLLVGRHRLPPVGDAVVVRPTSGGVTGRGGSTRHRAPTPYPAALWALETWADPDTVVLDPFAGLGTLGVAAAALGLDYLGAELVPEYAAVAARNIAVERPPLGLAL